MIDIPSVIPNWIDNAETLAATGFELDKFDPADGARLCGVTASQAEDVDKAVGAARRAQPGWGALPPVKRGMMLHDLALALRDNREDMARIVARETGKSLRDALGETDGAVALGLFYAGEGQRLYGRTTTSGVEGKYAMTVRRPVGVAGLIVAANTPIANVAWKVFPALVCGNGVVLKAAEDTPATAWLMGRIAKQAGLPDGALNIVQGAGMPAGSSLVEHRDVDVISFTGSTAVGRWIAERAGKRLAKISLELGGKNPLVVCDDADLDRAVRWTVLSAFSNAGQRCASASRIIVFDKVYDKFRERLLTATKKLRVGTGDEDDLGPVINERQIANMCAAVDRARDQGCSVPVGGSRLTGPEHTGGCFMAPTVIEGADPDADISTVELFGPICCLYRAQDFGQALDLANRSPLGLTAAIHTQNFDRAWEFCQRVEAGVAVVNAGTYGSEPHMPFGGVKDSGNGSREPGTEALDVYSDLKDIYLNADAGAL